MALRSLLIVTMIAVATGCESPPSDPWGGTKKLRVVTTFAPLQCFALNIVGEDAEVRSLLENQGPHHADPPTSQAKMLAGANIVFANGLHVDDGIVRRMTANFGKSGPKVYKLGNEIPKDLLIEGVCPCCKDEEHEHEAGHKSFDGHVWLGIDQAKLMIESMARHLDQLASESKSDSHRRAATAYNARLDRLLAEGKAMLKNKTERVILPFHGSLAYFARNFDLDLIEPIQDVPGQEPTAKHLEKIVDACIKKKVRLIAVEPQYGARTSAKTILDMLKQRGISDAEIIVIDPLETATESEFNSGWYEAKMRQNLETLAQHLK